MKKIIFLLMSLSLITISVPINKVSASGTLEFITFDSDITAVTHQEVIIPFQYVYSGNYYPEVSLLSSNFPAGMKSVGTLNGRNGLNTFLYSGTPVEPGKYEITILLTDNYGASLTKSFNLNVVNPEKIQILTSNLPTGYVGRSYYGNIVVFYVCNEPPMVGREGLPEGIEIKASSVKSSSNAIIKHGTTTIEFGGTPTKAGKYDVVIDLQNTDTDGNKNKLLRTFSINVLDTETQQQNQSNVSVATNQNQIISSSTNQSISEEKNRVVAVDAKLVNKLKGKILLQVESHGEAWYLNPKDGSRYYMANGNAAYDIMRKLSIGITNKDFTKLSSNKIWAKTHSGKIFIKTEDLGKAYYVDFSGDIHYLKDGTEAYNVMRELGLGIKNSDLEKIQVGE